VSSFHFLSHVIVVSIHSVIDRQLYIMFHPVFVSLCFCIIHFMFHSIPSSSSLGVLHYHNDLSCYDLHLTASSSSAHSTLVFFLTSHRTRMSHTGNILISLFILLSGDIQSNLEPFSRVSSLNMCTRNIRSFTNLLYYTAIAVSADTHNFDYQSATTPSIAL